MKLKQKYLFLVAVTPAILILDQITKQIIISRFHLGETLSIILGFFDLTYVRNTGAAFGFLAQADPRFRVPFFFIVPLVAIAAIAYIFKKIPEGDKKLSIALSLVIGGAVGNLIDRVIYGYVIDFFLFHWKYEYQFPAFNVADSAICIGVGILMLDLLTAKDPSESENKNASTSL
jgi:signal peptidase II